MKKTFFFKFFQACVSAALCLLLCLMSEPALASDPKGKVEEAVQGAWAKRDGNKVMLTKGAEIYEFDILQTDDTGSMTLHFIDDSYLELSNNTDIGVFEVINSDTSKRFNLSVTYGAAKIVSGMIVKANPKGFKITTPKSTVGIRGTTIAVNVRTDGFEKVKVIDISPGHSVNVTHRESKRTKIMRTVNSSVTITPRNEVITEGDVIDEQPVENKWPTTPDDDDNDDNDDNNNNNSPGKDDGPDCENDNSSPPR